MASYPQYSPHCPKTDRRTTGPDSLEALEIEVLRRLCNYGGSLSLTALKDALVEDGRMKEDSTEAGLRDFLVTHSPHNVFRLDDNTQRNECTVRAKTDAVLCQTYKPRHDECKEGQRCNAFHLCRDFISTRCNLGKKCNWPHSLRRNHNKNILKQNGLAHLCDDDILMILRQTWIDITVPDICKFYNTTRGCKYKEDCQFLHICRHYIQGDCTFSNANKQNCRYSHNVKDPQLMKVWKRYHIDAPSKSPLELITMLKEKKKQEADEDRDDDEDDDDDNDGSEEELLKPSGSKADETVPGICTFYNGKGCNKGDKCPYLHICSFIGNCKNSDGCQHSHDVQSSQCIAVWNRFDIDALNKMEAELLSIIPRKKLLDRDKRRSRNQSEPGVADNLDKNEICEYNLRGKCHFGDGCRKFHSDQPFQWQWTTDNGQTWESFAEENLSIEKSFCDNLEKKTNLKLKYNNIYFENY